MANNENPKYSCAVLFVKNVEKYLKDICIFLNINPNFKYSKYGKF